MDGYGERLRAERVRLGLKSMELAQIGNVGAVAQSNYERGKRHPDSVYLAAIAAAGVDVQYVLTGQRSAEPVLTQEEKDVLAAWRRAAPAVRAAAHAALLAGTDAQKPARQVIAGDVRTEQGGKTVIAENIGNLKM